MPSDRLLDAAAECLEAADWSAVRQLKRGPVPSEPFEPGDVLNVEKPMTQAQWNRMLMTGVFFDGHRDYVNTQMAESLSRDASLALIDVLEKGAPLPLADAIRLETEAFLRLAGNNHLPALNRAHFFALAATTMRRVLVDHAREYKALKRGGGVYTIALEDESRAKQVLRVIDALEEHDDVQNVYANFDIPDAVLQSVMA